MKVIFNTTFIYLLLQNLPKVKYAPIRFIGIMYNKNE